MAENVSGIRSAGSDDFQIILNDMREKVHQISLTDRLKYSLFMTLDKKYIKSERMASDGSLVNVVQCSYQEGLLYRKVEEVLQGTFSNLKY